MKYKKKDIEIFLLNYFLEKEGNSFKNILKKVDLVNEGYIDSLDMVTLSFLIEKKFNIKPILFSSFSKKGIKDLELELFKACDKLND